MAELHIHYNAGGRCVTLAPDDHAPNQWRDGDVIVRRFVDGTLRVSYNRGRHWTELGTIDPQAQDLYLPPQGQAFDRQHHLFRYEHVRPGAADQICRVLSEGAAIEVLKIQFEQIGGGINALYFAAGESNPKVFSNQQLVITKDSVAYLNGTISVRREDNDYDVTLTGFRKNSLGGSAAVSAGFPEQIDGLTVRVPRSRDPRFPDRGPVVTELVMRVTETDDEKQYEPLSATAAVAAVARTPARPAHGEPAPDADPRDEPAPRRPGRPVPPARVALPRTAVPAPADPQPRPDDHEQALRTQLAAAKRDGLIPVDGSDIDAALDREGLRGTERATALRDRLAAWAVRAERRRTAPPVAVAPPPVVVPDPQPVRPAPPPVIDPRPSPDSDEAALRALLTTAKTQGLIPVNSDDIDTAIDREGLRDTQRAQQIRARLEAWGYRALRGQLLKAANVQIRNYWTQRFTSGAIRNVEELYQTMNARRGRTEQVDTWIALISAVAAEVARLTDAAAPEPAAPKAPDPIARPPMEPTIAPRPELAAPGTAPDHEALRTLLAAAKIAGTVPVNGDDITAALDREQLTGPARTQQERKRLEDWALRALRARLLAATAPAVRAYWTQQFGGGSVRTLPALRQAFMQRYSPGAVANYEQFFRVVALEAERPAGMPTPTSARVHTVAELHGKLQALGDLLSTQWQVTNVTIDPPDPQGLTIHIHLPSIHAQGWALGSIPLIETTLRELVGDAQLDQDLRWVLHGTMADEDVNALQVMLYGKLALCPHAETVEIVSRARVPTPAAEVRSVRRNGEAKPPTAAVEPPAPPRPEVVEATPPPPRPNPAPAVPDPKPDPAQPAPKPQSDPAPVVTRPPAPEPEPAIVPPPESEPEAVAPALEPKPAVNPKTGKLTPEQIRINRTIAALQLHRVAGRPPQPQLTHNTVRFAMDGTEIAAMTFHAPEKINPAQLTKFFADLATHIYKMIDATKGGPKGSEFQPVLVLQTCADHEKEPLRSSFHAGMRTVSEARVNAKRRGPGEATDINIFPFPTIDYDANQPLARIAIQGEVLHHTMTLLVIPKTAADLTGTDFDPKLKQLYQTWQAAIGVEPAAVPAPTSITLSPALAEHETAGRATVIISEEAILLKRITGDATQQGDVHFLTVRVAEANRKPVFDSLITRVRQIPGASLAIMQHWAPGERYPRTPIFQALNQRELESGGQFRGRYHKPATPRRYQPAKQGLQHPDVFTIVFLPEAASPDATLLEQVFIRIKQEYRISEEQ